MEFELNGSCVKLCTPKSKGKKRASYKYAGFESKVVRLLLLLHTRNTGLLPPLLLLSLLMACSVPTAVLWRWARSLDNTPK